MKIRNHHPAIISKALTAAWLLFSIPTLLYADFDRDARGTRGMVAAAHPLASQVGVEILQAGGNAVDAAVAVGFALSVIEPNASGVGGGGFMLIWLAEEQRAVFIDYREKAPGAATPDMYPLDADGKVIRDERGFNPAVAGGRAVAVPGHVAGHLLALERHGSMSREQVLRPAIRHAQEGLEVSEVLAGIITDNYEVIEAFPATAELYLNEGFPKSPGDVVRNTDLAATLERIASEGKDAFYQGPVAQAIVDAVQADGGILSLQDLAEYAPTVREPLRGTYRGYEIIAAAPPSSGGAHVIELLNIMEHFDPYWTGHFSPESLHAWAEAMKLTYADRAEYMGDPEFVDVPVERLISKEYARDRFALIDSSRVLRNVVPGNAWPLESASTSHFSVADAAGNMVACTQTINHFFGSGITAPGTGVLLNDQMDDFDKRPGQANSVAAGKRPLSSMSPILLLEDGQPFAAIGSPGGKRIISTMGLLISAMIDHDLDLQDAIEAPRITNYENGKLTLEGRIPPLVRQVLELKGHELSVRKDYDLYFGGAQGVIIDHDTGELIGGADPRRDGKAVGY